MTPERAATSRPLLLKGEEAEATGHYGRRMTEDSRGAARPDVMRTVITYTAAALAALALAASPAGAHRTHHGYPAYWLREAACIRHYESRDEWHIPDGAYQIIPSTWHSFKPPAWPERAENNSPPRQTFVAWRDWIHNGRSWGANHQWPNTARMCGVR